MRNGAIERSSTFTGDKIIERNGSVEKMRDKLTSQRAESKIDELLKNKQMQSDARLKGPVCDAPY